MNIHKKVINYVERIGKKIDDGWTYIANHHKFSILSIGLFIQGLLLLSGLIDNYLNASTIIQRILIIVVTATLPPICFLVSLSFQLPKFHHHLFDYLDNRINTQLFNKLRPLYNYDDIFESIDVENKVRDVMYYTNESWDVFESGAGTIYITCDNNPIRVLAIASKIYYWCDNIQFISKSEADKYDMISNDIIITNHVFNFKLEMGEDFAVITSNTFQDSMKDYEDRKDKGKVSNFRYIF